MGIFSQLSTIQIHIDNLTTLILLVTFLNAYHCFNRKNRILEKRENYRQNLCACTKLK